MVRLPSAITVQWNGKTVESSAVISPSPARASNKVTVPRATSYWTILAIGISRMPVAPWSFNAGMSVLMSCFATTVSTA